jgi:hypothetical protein
MKFEIRHTNNGALLRVEHDYPEGETEEICYQETEGGEIEAFADFLRFLNDHYGPSANRYSPKRIHILVKPGDKHYDFKDDEFP